MGTSVYDLSVQGTGPPDQEVSTDFRTHSPLCASATFFWKKYVHYGSFDPSLHRNFLITHRQHSNPWMSEYHLQSMMFWETPRGMLPFFNALCIVLIKLYHTPQDFFVNFLGKPTEILIEGATDERENSINQHCFLFLSELRLKDKGFNGNNNSNNKGIISHVNKVFSAMCLGSVKMNSDLWWANFLAWGYSWIMGKYKLGFNNILSEA